MVDSGSMNMMGRCVGSDNIVENFKFFDFPLENVEGGAYEEEEDVEECDDWNAKLQSALGPIPVEFLSEYLNGNITNGGSELKISDCGPVTDEGGSELTKPSHLIEDISATNKAEAVQPLSPISVLDDNYSHMFATHIPRRARTKRSRPLNNNTWTFIVPERDVTRKKRKISEKKTITSNTSGASKRCSHCQVTQTPQWREGPLGPKTLCNACGVRYRSGRLFPEYRPMASPGFVPSLHSNSHKKVLEMRNKGSNMNIHDIRENVAPAPPRRRVKKAAPVYERDNSPPPEFIPMSDYLLDCVLGSEVFNY